MAKKVSKKAPVAALAVHPNPESSKVVKKKKNTKATTAAVGAVAATTPSAPSTKASPKAAPEAAPAPASPKVKETAKKGKKRPAASQKQDTGEKKPNAASLMGCSVPPSHSPSPSLFLLLLSPNLLPDHVPILLDVRLVGLFISGMPTHRNLSCWFATTLPPPGLEAMPPASAAPTHDQTLTCIDCSKGFVWTAKDQKIFTAKGYGNTPKRCRDHASF